MVLRTVALDLWAAGVLFSLASIVLAGASWAAVCLLTVARARRQHRQRARCPGPLPGMSEDLAEIDDALERILSEERGAAWQPR
jgi:Flp pilus assembly protein TadB